jgi:glutaminase
MTYKYINIQIYKYINFLLHLYINMLGLDTEAIITKVYNETKNNTTGKLATYIPQLGNANPKIFGISICDLEGNIYNIGDAKHKVPIESISKLFSLALACKKLGPKIVFDRIGSHGSFLPFNSIIAAKLAPTHTINPFVNQGAMATTSLLYQPDQKKYKEKLVDNMSKFANKKLQVGESVYKSESATHNTNMSLAYLLKSLNRFYGPVDKVVDAYTYQCSVKINAEDLAVMAAVFANAGVHPETKQKILDKSDCGYILNNLQPEGLYEYSETWMIKTNGGAYAKSGVGGGILIVIPNVCGIGIVSPKLDNVGNSVRGIQAGIKLSKIFGKKLFKKN